MDTQSVARRVRQLRVRSMTAAPVSAHRVPLRPCNPSLHAAYTRMLDDGSSLPPALQESIRTLVQRSITASEEEAVEMEAEIVDRTYWYVLRPDQIARAIVGRRWRIREWEAARILAACGEAGYDIRAPIPQHPHTRYLPTRGATRDQIIWESAEYWAAAAARDRYQYVSLGDCRGYLPRPVQHDMPGSMAPEQQAAITFGPASGEQAAAYMRRHTRRLFLVERAAADGTSTEDVRIEVAGRGN